MFAIFVSHLYKLKRQPVIWGALVCPLLLSIAFVWYYSFAPWEIESKISGYFQTLGISLPLFLGFLTAYVAEQECVAGNFFNILSLTRSRMAQFLALYFELLFLTLASYVVAIGAFALLFGEMQQVAYVLCTVLFCIPLPCLLMIQLACALKGGTLYATSAAAVFLLLAALTVAGLFAGIWFLLPSVWPSMFSGYMIYDAFHPEQILLIAAKLRLGLMCCVVESLAAFVFVPVWFKRWDGPKGSNRE